VLEQIVARFGEHPQFKLDDNMDAYLSLQRSALMVSDWSGAALEFAFAYQRPIVFVNVPRKIQNEAYTQLELEPIEVRIRQDIGQVIQQQDIGLIGKIAQELMRNSEKWQNNISYVRKKTVFNLNSSGKIAADYVMSSIKK
jgi:YidC/Oxa1 family membrane protein insertase